MLVIGAGGQASAEMHNRIHMYVCTMYSGVISRGAWAPLEFRKISTTTICPKNIDFPHEVVGRIRFCTPSELTEFLRKMQYLGKSVGEIREKLRDS